MSHSVQITTAWAPSHASYGSLEMVTSRDTINNSNEKLVIRKELSEITHFNARIVGAESLTEVEWTVWLKWDWDNGRGPGATPNLAIQRSISLEPLACLEYVGTIIRLTHSWSLQIKDNETMPNNLILEKWGWKKGLMIKTEQQNRHVSGPILKMTHETESLTLVILWNPWMRKIHNYLFPWYFWIIYMEVCTLIHQIFANIYTRRFSEGKKISIVKLLMAYILTSKGFNIQVRYYFLWRHGCSLYFYTICVYVFQTHIITKNQDQMRGREDS